MELVFLISLKSRQLTAGGFCICTQMYTFFELRKLTPINPILTFKNGDLNKPPYQRGRSLIFIRAREAPINPICTMHRSLQLRCFYLCKPTQNCVNIS